MSVGGLDRALFSQLIIAFLLSSSSDLEFSFSNTGSDLGLSFSNPGLFEFQVWNKPGIEKLNSRSTLISPLTGEGGPPSQTKTMQNTVRWPWLFLYISLSSSSEFCNFLKLQLRSSNKIGFKHLKSRGPRSRWFEND